MLVGSAVDANDAVDNASLLEKVAQKLHNNDVTIIALTNEENEAVLDQRLSEFKVVIARFDAAHVAAEVDEARQMEAEMARQAKQELRNEKKAARKEKREEKKAKMSAEWEGFKAKFKKKDK